MRQETGSNSHDNNKIVSIRITSNGHNFSDNTTTFSSADNNEVIIVIESVKAMLLPTPLLENCSAEEHLLSAGIDFQSNIEEVIAVEHDNITTALIVIPISLLNDVHIRFGKNVYFTTPLLAPAIKRDKELRLHLSTDQTLLCINLFNGGERLFAELFEIKNSCDVLYWLTRIGEGYDLSNYTIYIDGGDKELYKLLKKYYKSIELCE